MAMTPEFPLLEDRLYVGSEDDLLGLVGELSKKPLDGSWAPDGVLVYHVPEELRATKTPDDVRNILNSIIPEDLSNAEKGPILSRQHVKSLSDICRVYHLGNHSACLPPKLKTDWFQQARNPLSYQRWADDYYASTCQDDDSEQKKCDTVLSKMFNEHLPQTTTDARATKGGGLQGLIKGGEDLKESFERRSAMPPEKAVAEALSTSSLLPTACMDSECQPISDSDGETIHSYRPLPPEYNNIIYGHGEVDTDPLRITKSFSLSYLWNILFMYKHTLPGLMVPFFYLGMLNTKFPVHIEDCLLWSINYLHFGAYKVWIVIPPYARQALDHILGLYGYTYLVNKACRNVLGHKVLFPTLALLQRCKIPYKVILQKPGDLVVLLPDSAHFGFNLGWNLAEAINFATPSWIPIGINVLRCNVLSHMPELLRAFLSNEFIATPYHAKSAVFLQETLLRLGNLSSGVSNSPSMQQTKETQEPAVAGPSKGGRGKVKAVKQEAEGIASESSTKCIMKNCRWQTRNKVEQKRRQTIIKHLEFCHVANFKRDKDTMLKQVNNMFSGLCLTFILSLSFMATAE